MRSYRFLAALFAASCIGFASAGVLSVGDMAPPIKVSKWVQGDPVSNGVGGLRVVEFWATWCGPCKESIPHLTELSKKYKGKVTFTGVDVYERSPDDVATVKAFVKAMGAKMGYKVAVDDKTGTMGKTWMEAANQDGIPTAFVIDQKGEIAWIGHPMMGLEEALDQMIAGKYDLAKAKSDFAATQQKEQDQAEQQEVRAKIQEAETEYKAGKKTESMALLDQLAVSHPKLKNGITMTKFVVLLDDDKKAATAIVEQEATAADAMGQAPYAYLQFGMLASRNPQASKDDLALSLTLADKALAKGPTDPIVDYEASMIYFRNGNTTKALSLANDALKNLPNAKPQIQAPLKEAVQRDMAQYQAKLNPPPADKKPAAKS